MLLYLLVAFVVDSYCHSCKKAFENAFDKPAQVAVVVLVDAFSSVAIVAVLFSVVVVLIVVVVANTSNNSR